MANNNRELSQFANRITVDDTTKVVSSASTMTFTGGSAIEFTEANGGVCFNNRLGSCAGRCNTTGCYNNFFGRCAGFANTTGCNNNFLGVNAGRDNTTGQDNNFFGRCAGRSNTTGFNNNFFGQNAGCCNTSGRHNNFLGNAAGIYNTTGCYNNFFGQIAGRCNTTGCHNNFLGERAGQYNTTGCYNNFFGRDAGRCNTTGSCNTFLGRYAGCSNTTGSHNVAIGNNAQLPSATGSCQLVIGSAGVNWLYGDSSGRLLVGTTLTASAGNSQYSLLQVKGGSGLTSAVLSLTRAQAATSIQNSDAIGSIAFGDEVGNPYTYITCEADAASGANDFPGRLVFSTTADGASSPTERMRITSAGDLLLGSTPPSSNARFTLNVAATGNNAIAVRNIASTADHWTIFIGANATTSGWNNNNTINFCSKDTGTGRSINAAGTINASGADYAEYMTKAGDFTLAKGALCGITATGLLTNNYSDAVNFVVKSTNPSYVGGDAWGNSDAIGDKPGKDENGEIDEVALLQWEADLEAARQAVDRIAFAGQVPVNVTGATPGQYIIPVQSADGGIEGVAKDELDLTLTEYMRAVGKVIAIEDDGRARIIVKVA